MTLLDHLGDALSRRAKDLCAERPRMADVLQGLAADVVQIAASETPDAPHGTIRFIYRNHRGVMATRRARVLGLRWGTSDWHIEPQWLLVAFDIDKTEHRDFALRDMTPVPVEEGTHG